ncbi:MAG: hypothetical protein GF350_14900 [Chitinivibrionales bacterium]|nr:hypothetical protein [Chitinivibrionales bacterium]
MCNHVYKSEFRGLPKAIGKYCPYPEIFEQIKPGNGIHRGLPLDKNGICIFHSPDIEWKRQNKFSEYLVTLLHLLDSDDFYDFSEIIFVGNEVRKKPKPEHLSLRFSGMTFKKQAYFTGSIFQDALELEDVHFKGGANFDQTILNHDLIVKNTIFQGLSFAKSELNRRVLFSGTDFHTYGLFHKTKFTGFKNAGNGYVIKFENARFHFLADFSEAVFTPVGNQSVASFVNVEFKDVADFKKARFHNQVLFKETTFSYITEFIDTQFDLSDSSIRYGGDVAVDFNRIQLRSGKAFLAFRSTDPKNKMFNHDVNMSFEEDLEGVIYLENVNFNNFTPDSRERLITLSRSGKVEIGPGCIKYRFQTEIKSISINQDNSPLILELCQTFTNYFSASNGLSLGFEIVERSKTKVSFFYFTDENISKKEFHERLAATEQHLWNLLSITPNEESLALNYTDNEALSTEEQSRLINVFDGVSALIGTFFRVGARIALGTWKPKDTKALLNAINFHDRNLNDFASNLHKVLVDKYTGKTLLAINFRQNKHLPPIANITYNLTGNNARVYNESVDNSVNIKNSD